MSAKYPAVELDHLADRLGVSVSALRHIAERCIFLDEADVEHVPVAEASRLLDRPVEDLLAAVADLVVLDDPHYGDA